MELQTNNTIVRRDFASDILQNDTFSIVVNDEVIAIVSHDQAREFWLGRITLDELVHQVA